MMSMCAYRIKTLLKERKISVAEFMIATDTKKDLLSNMRKGHAISCVTLYRIAEYLEVSMDYLLGRTNNSNILYSCLVEEHGMQYDVNSEGKRVHAPVANKNEEYFCPTCGHKVIPVQGECNVAHLVHESTCSDPWRYEVSEWHSQWQEQFPADNREVVVEHLGEKHRADVMVGDYVIEFHHSSITLQEFEKRNDFYISCGKKVVWIFDLINEWFEGTIELYGEWKRGFTSGGKFKWTSPKQFLINYIPQKDKDIIVFFQLSKSTHTDITSAYIQRVIWAIAKDGVSDFKCFFTSDNYPGNARELLEWIKNKKL